MSVLGIVIVFILLVVLAFVIVYIYNNDFVVLEGDEETVLFSTSSSGSSLAMGSGFVESSCCSKDTFIKYGFDYVESTPEVLSPNSFYVEDCGGCNEVLTFTRKMKAKAILKPRLFQHFFSEGDCGGCNEPIVLTKRMESKVVQKVEEPMRNFYIVDECFN